MAEDIKISSSKDLKAWLENKPTEWAQIIAIRTALRVFPFVTQVLDLPDDVLSTQHKQGLALQTWRAMCISSLIRKYPSNRMINAAARASNAAGHSASFVAVYAARAAAGAARAAYYGATDTADAAAEIAAVAAAETVYAAVDAAANAARAADAALAETKIWQSITGDCRILLTRGLPDLEHLPLWNSDIPKWADEKIENMGTLAQILGSNALVIVRWYTFLLVGKSPPFQDANMLKLCQSDNAFWEITDQRPAEQIMDEITDLLRPENETARTLKSTLQDKPLAQQIIELLKAEAEPKTIDEIRTMLLQKGINFVDSSLRRDLGKLTNDKQILRIEKGLYQYNNKNEDAEDTRVPEQRPAAFQFRLRNNKLSAIVPAADPSDHEMTTELLAEVSQKANDLVKRMGQTNSHHRVVSSVEKLLEALPADPDSVNAGLLRSRARSIESDAAAFANEQDELFPDAISMMTDLASALRDLQGCFVAIRSLEAEVLALDLVGKDLDAVKTELDNVVYAIRETDEVADETALDALTTMQEIAEESGDQRVVEKKTADYALVVRNAASAIVKHSKNYVVDAGKSVRKGSLSGIEKSTEAVVKTSLVVVAGNIGGPLAALGMIILSFVPLGKAALEDSQPEKDSDDENGGIEV